MDHPTALDRFVVIDVETANSDYASICQIGVVEFDLRGPTSEWSVLVDPEDDFDYFNVSIHGIKPDHVRGQPNFRSICTDLNTRLLTGLTMSYSWFDRSAVAQATTRYGLRAPTYRWIDATSIVRRTWPECAHGGYRLKKVAKMLDIKMERHHDALSDARTAGLIVLAALKRSGIGLDEWLTRVKKPITAPAAARKAFVSADEIDREGPLQGECVVFTGELTLPRREAMEIVLRAGGEVGDSLTKKTTILVVGNQDPAKVGQSGRSSKQRKAEALILAGQEIDVISENSFYQAIAGTVATSSG